MGYTILFSGESASADEAKQFEVGLFWQISGLLRSTRSSSALIPCQHRNFPLMVAMILAIPRTIYTMNNTIDDADYIIIFQCVTKSVCSRSNVNQRLLRFDINGLLGGAGDDTMPKNPANCSEKC